MEPGIENNDSKGNIEESHNESLRQTQGALVDAE